MSEQQLDDKNISELLFYLNNIKLMDKLRILQIDTVIIVIWALLSILASFSETFLNISTGSSFTIIIWLITLGFGAIITIFLKQQIFLTHRPKFTIFTKSLILTFTIGVLIAILFDFIFKINEVIFPLYSILLAIYTYSVLNPYYSTRPDIFTKNKRLIVPIGSLLGGIINVIGVILEDMDPVTVGNVLGNQYFAAFESLIYSIFLGSSMIILALLNNKDINTYINNIDIAD